ncbi:hypothetical protein [Novosphingobium huizhouense]|uniref:hypothetical protein n=1 Tax=Novosphingobium huizhouense TaxID=2866625 RepID=UPI001CD889FE|nr:hypothetical protein [Novosphingobium huizhouense]
MPDVAADPIGALVALLLADSDIAAIAAARGYGGELPAAQTRLMPRPAFVLRASGGVSLTAGSNAEIDAQRVDLFAYGETPNVAGQLADLIALKLRRVERRTVNGTLIHWVKSAGGYSSGREPETDWPRAWRSFQVMFALARIS